jgi:hypothetical protein
VREAKEGEGLGLPEPTGRPVAGGEAPELDQPRLAGVQLQGELREAFAKVTEELFGITEVLEAHDEVISLCRCPDYAEAWSEGLLSGGSWLKKLGITRCARGKAQKDLGQSPDACAFRDTLVQQRGARGGHASDLHATPAARCIGWSGLCRGFARARAT